MSSLPNYPRGPEVLVWLRKTLDVEAPDCFTAGVVQKTDDTLIHVTRCNAYVRCACAICGVQVPSRMTADELCAYFAGPIATSDGWQVVDFETAKNRAESGYPTIALWHSRPPDTHGHVAIMMPRPTDRQLSLEQFAAGWCSAAGGLDATHQLCTLAATFGTARVPQLVFVTHD